MTDPQSNLSDVPETEQQPAAPAFGSSNVPSPDQLNARDGSAGALVGDLPTDEHPQDLVEGRARTAWDAGTATDAPHAD